MWLGAIANLENERVIEKLSDVILVYVCCLLLFFWLLLADSTHLTAFLCFSVLHDLVGRFKDRQTLGKGGFLASLLPQSGGLYSVAAGMRELSSSERMVSRSS